SIERVPHDDADRIAGLIVNAGSFERELDMPNILIGIARRQTLIREDRRKKGILARVRRRDRRQRRLESRLLCGGNARVLARDAVDDGIDPLARVLLVIDVTIHSRVKPLSSECGKAGVELPARFAESLVTRV